MREDERSKWTQEQIVLNFRDCNFHLGHIISKLYGLQRDQKKDIPGLEEHEAELSKSLTSLLVAWPDKETEPYRELRKRLWLIYCKPLNELDIMETQSALVRMVTGDPLISLRSPENQQATKPNE